jgi:hypothetical protein
MSHPVRETGRGFPTETLLQQWQQSYARGDYTEVVHCWLQVAAQTPDWRLCDHAVLAEAVGWSLGSTVLKLPALYPRL